MLVVLVAGGAALSVQAASKQRPGTDFHAKWMFGRLFYAGEPVYVLRPDVRGPPNYPPFAAMAFQVLAVFPLKVAAGLFYFGNLVLTVLAVRLTRRVVRRLWPESDARVWPLVVAAACTAQFYLNNLNLVQIDVLLFVVVLWAITAYLDGRDVAAAAGFVVATAVKLVPVFFVLWLLVRGRRRAVIAAVPIAAACLLLPIVQRGPERGIQDLKDYHALALKGVGEGEIDASYTNQSLGAAIHRATRPPPKPDARDYRVLDASAPTARTVARVAAALVALALVANLYWLRRSGDPLSAFEFGAVFLTGHLVSAITWKSHLVTLLFVVYAILTIPRRPLPGAWRAGLGALAIAFGVVGIAGRDIVGNDLHHWIGGFSLLVWTMLLAWAAVMTLSHRRFRVWEGSSPREFP